MEYIKQKSFSPALFPAPPPPLPPSSQSPFPILFPPFSLSVHSPPSLAPLPLTLPLSRPPPFSLTPFPSSLSLLPFAVQLKRRSASAAESPLQGLREAHVILGPYE